MGDIELPELHEGILDAELLTAYFADLRDHTELLGVMAKSRADEYAAPGALSLQDGHDLLAVGAIRGLQVRYRFDGREWWDTLVRVPGAVRLVRIEQTFR